MSAKPSNLSTGLAQAFDGLALLPDVLELLREQRREIAALRADVAELRGKRAAEEERKWLRLREAAEQLNTSPKTVRRYIDRGFLSRNAASRHILIPREDVEGLRKKVVL